MKEGDKVICIENFRELDRIARLGAFKPIKGDEYVISSILETIGGTGIRLKGYCSGPTGYKIEKFRKLSPPMTNAYTRELVKELTENDKLRQIEKEKLFTTKADF